MTSRQDIQSLQDRVYEAKRALEEMKTSPQAMTGDSWVMYRHDARPGWDYEIHGIADSTWKKQYKVTYQVLDPSRGFMNMFYFLEFDTPAQDISFYIDPFADDPYSFYLTVLHVNYNSDPAGLKMRFLIFSPQKGNLVIQEL